MDVVLNLPNPPHPPFHTSFAFACAFSFACACAPREKQQQQVAETLRVRDLANLISSKTGCGVRNLENPRKEDAGTYIHILVLALAPLHWLTVVT